DANLAAEQPRDLSADGQTQPSAAVFASRGPIGLLKRLEDNSLLFWGDADAGIADGESDDFADAVERIEIILFILRRRRDLQHDIAVFSELESVGQQVHKYLL